MNFRSPLVWDVFAISTYFTISLVFWYLGMIPDLATLRDRATTGIKKVVFRPPQPGLERLAADLVPLRDRSAWCWPALATPLVLSVHSIVSMDFATSLVPGWHTTIFPPYFVAGAIYSGFGMVLTLLIITRQTMHLERYITLDHLEAMAKVILLDRIAGRLRLRDGVLHRLVLGQPLRALPLHQPRDRPVRLVLLPDGAVQRADAAALLVEARAHATSRCCSSLSILINVGMWFERFVIIVVSLHRDFLPSAWGMFYPTVFDIGILVGVFGLFFTLFLLFIRALPMIAMWEVKGRGGTDRRTTACLVGRASRSPTACCASVRDAARARASRVHDVFAPYPVHGLDAAMGIRRSRLPFVTLLAGLAGLCFALAFQYYTAVFDWPLDVGGKPENSTLAFVPICFELTVLIGGLGTVGGFLLRARLFPGKREQLPVLGVTNNVFALVVTPAPRDGNDAELARRIMLESGADEVEEREADA